MKGSLTRTGNLIVLEHYGQVWYLERDTALALLELLPEWKHPVLAKTVREMLEELGGRSYC